MLPWEWSRNFHETLWNVLLHLTGLFWGSSFHRMTAWENHCRNWNWLSVMSCLNSYASIKRTVRPAIKPRMPSRLFWRLCMLFRTQLEVCIHVVCFLSLEKSLSSSLRMCFLICRKYWILCKCYCLTPERNSVNWDRSW